MPQYLRTVTTMALTSNRMRLWLAASALTLLSACQSTPSQPAAASTQAPAAATAPAASAAPAPSAATPVSDDAQPLDAAPATPILGKHADSHGCKPSTGHAWCERSKSCERPWELALKRGFENTPDGWKAYCEGTGR